MVARAVAMPTSARRDISYLPSWAINYGIGRLIGISFYWCLELNYRLDLRVFSLSVVLPIIAFNILFARHAKVSSWHSITISSRTGMTRDQTAAAVVENRTHPPLPYRLFRKLRLSHPSARFWFDVMSLHILKLNCPDAVELLARVTGFIAASGGNLLDLS